MALLETWRNLAYGDGLDDKKREELWSGYFQIEKGIYEQILSQPEQVITGTVKELAEKYNTEILIMTGFLDGINESLKVLLHCAPARRYPRRGTHPTAR